MLPLSRSRETKVCQWSVCKGGSVSYHYRGCKIDKYELDALAAE